MTSPTLPQPTATSTLAAADRHARYRRQAICCWDARSSSVGNATRLRVYPYGGTNGGRLQVHHGVDLVNPLGTPIHAAGDGTVVYAGDDLTTRFAPINDYYGNLVVIQHNFLSPEGLPVFTLYGHMSGHGAGGAGRSRGRRDRHGRRDRDRARSASASGGARRQSVRFRRDAQPGIVAAPYPNFGVLAGRVIDSAGRCRCTA